jgi:hypothetical protein
MTIPELQAKLNRLAALGVTVSFVHGHCGYLKRVCWSVDVLTLRGQSFFSPFAANSLEHCLEIAVKECIERGWLDRAALDAPTQ